MPTLRRLLTLSVLALAALPAAAVLRFDPATMMRESELRPGMKGYGLTVFSGTTIQRFPLTVLGVLEKIDFGANLILVRLEGKQAQRYGIVAGMSGSPVYVNGRLVGALSVAFPFSKEPIAGVTPIARMLEDYDPADSRPVAMQAGALQATTPVAAGGQRYDRAQVMPVAPAGPVAGSLVLTPIATPLLVSGMGGRAVSSLEKRLARYGLRVLAVPGGGPPRGAQPAPLQPGSAVGVMLMSGDVEAMAVGTVTYVKDGEVLAFGHPLFGLGAVDIPLVGAWVHSVVPNLEVSFKMASALGPAGRLVQDRAWTVGGRLGENARTTAVEMDIRDLDRGNRRSWALRVLRERDLTPLLVYDSLFWAVESVAPALKGTTTVRLEVTAPGLPAMVRENSYCRPEAASLLEMMMSESPFSTLPMGELMELMDTLENNRFGPLPVEKIAVAVGVTEKRRTAVVERAYADRQKVRPGDTVRLAVDIQPYGEDKVRRELEVRVPDNAPAGTLRLGVGGGASAGSFNSNLGLSRPRPTNLEQMVQEICARERSTDLLVEMVFANGSLLMGGVEMTDLPNSLLEMVRSSPISNIRVGRNHQRTTYPTPWVLHGSQVLRLTVETDQQDKAGPVPSGGTSALEEEGFGQLFQELLRGGSRDLSAGRTTAGAASEEPDAGDEDESGGSEDEGEDEEEASDEGISSELSGLAGIGESMAEAMGLRDAGTPAGGKQRRLGQGTRSWVQAEARQFAAGKLEGTAISGQALVVGPRVEPLFSCSDRILWSTAAGGGAAYVCGWLEGEVWRLAEGRADPVLKTSSPVVSALAVGPEGTLWAAAMPGGEIHRLTPGGTAALHCKLEAPYVWALLPQADGSVLAATGPRGGLYRVSPEGKAELVFRAPDRHLLGLAPAPEGGVFVGTYPMGKVYLVSASGSARACFEVPRYALQSLASDDQGNLFVGTTPRAQVYRVSPEGTIVRLYDGPGKHVHALLADGKGGVYAGVNNPARVLHLAGDGTVAILYTPKASQILSLTREQGDLLVLEAGSGRVVRLREAAHAEGEYLSPVVDAGSPATWGRLVVTGTCQPTVEIRTGDTAAPDATWSEWTPLGADGRVGGRPARCLQYRLRLVGDKSAQVTRVELLYRPRNRAPEIKVVSPQVGEIWSGKKKIRYSTSDPDEDSLVTTIWVSADGGKTWRELAKEQPKEQPKAPVSLPRPPAKPATKGKPTASKASALPSFMPDLGDMAAMMKEVEGAVSSILDSGSLGAMLKEATGELQASLGESKEGEGKAKSTSGSQQWDTTRFPDGQYLLKVVTSDRPDNPEGALTAQQTAGPITVDNGKPEVAKVGETPPGNVPLILLCRDEGSYVVSVRYQVDNGEWLPAAPADGVLDGAREQVRLDPAVFPRGAHMLQVQVRDAAGNETKATFPYLKP